VKVLVPLLGGNVKSVVKPHSTGGWGVQTRLSKPPHNTCWQVAL